MDDVISLDGDHVVLCFSTVLLEVKRNERLLVGIDRPFPSFLLFHSLLRTYDHHE